MPRPRTCASATGRRIALTLALLCAPGAGAAELDLDDAVRLATEHQPLLDAAAARADAAGASAIAAGQLPDPELITGLSDVPVEGSDRYSLRRDQDTEFQLGLRQRFPGSGQRRLQARIGQLGAERLAAETGEQRRMIQREAGRAWLDVWRAAQAQQLLQASATEAQRALDVARIGYRSGSASQDAVLAAEVDHELLLDRIAATEQAQWHARNQLRRWIGDAAEQPVAAQLPHWPTPRDTHLLAALQGHPHLQAQDAGVAAAEAGIELARARYRPDWSLQVAYGHRRDYDDMAGIQLEVALPFFTARRQDQTLAARREQLSAAQAEREDWLRQHRADIALNVEDWQRLQTRFARYDDVILPRATGRLEAAIAAYGSGAGSLDAVIAARRALLDARLMRLDLELDAARHQVELRYFSHDGAEPAPMGEPS